MCHTSHANCMSSNLLATRAFFVLERAATREKGLVACSTIVMQLHVFQHGRNCMSSNMLATGLFVLSEGPTRRGASCMFNHSHAIACLSEMVASGVLFFGGLATCRWG